jgi:hypothetical protein
MSKINDGLYSSESQCWMTPPELVQGLLRLHGRQEFDLDPCTTDFNIPANRACRVDGEYLRIASGKYIQNGYRDGLTYPWHGLVFLNPPYDRAKEFLAKACQEAANGCRIWAVVPARTETIYQHEYGIAAANFTVFIKGRVNFIPDEPTREKLIHQWTVKQMAKGTLPGMKDSQPLLFEPDPALLRPMAEKAVDDGTAPFPTILLYWGHDWKDVMARWLNDPPKPGTLMTCPK